MGDSRFHLGHVTRPLCADTVSYSYSHVGKFLLTGVIALSSTGMVSKSWAYLTVGSGAKCVSVALGTRITGGAIPVAHACCFRGVRLTQSDAVDWYRQHPRIHIVRRPDDFSYARKSHLRWRPTTFRDSGGRLIAMPTYFTSNHASSGCLNTDETASS